MVSAIRFALLDVVQKNIRGVRYFGIDVICCP